MHFLVGMQCPKSLFDKMSSGAKKMCLKVSEANGNIPVCPKEPYITTSRDNKLQFFHTGSATKTKDEIWLCSFKRLAEKRFCSQYCPVEQTTNLHGLHLKLTFTFSANGQMTAIFVSATGFTKAKMCPDKCPSSILVMKIPGLAIGAAVDLQNAQAGFLCFCHSDSSSSISIDQRQHKLHMKHAYIPFIAALHQSHDSIIPSLEIPDSKSSIGWSDGDWAQINAAAVTKK